MNTQDFIERTQQNIANLQETLRLEQLRLNLISAKMAAFNEEKFVEALDKVGVRELSRSCRFKEVIAYSRERVTEEELRAESLALDLRVNSIKIKPIMFAGYTKSGSGRNNDRLIAKAEKLKESFEKHTGYKCGINHYGMEVKSQTDNFNFSVTVRIY